MAWGDRWFGQLAVPAKSLSPMSSGNLHPIIHQFQDPERILVHAAKQAFQKVPANAVRSLAKDGDSAESCMLGKKTTRFRLEGQDACGTCACSHIKHVLGVPEEG